MLHNTYLGFDQMESQRTATPVPCMAHGGTSVGRSLTHVIGAASWLSHQDPDAFNWPIQDFHQRICSALECGQALLFEDGDMPTAFVTWAWLTQDADQRYRLQSFPLPADERKGGSYLWLIEALVLQPYTKSVAQYVLNKAFETGTPVRWLSRGPAGRVNRTVSGAGEEEKLWHNWP